LRWTRSFRYCCQVRPEAKRSGVTTLSFCWVMSPPYRRLGRDEDSTKAGDVAMLPIGAGLSFFSEGKRFHSWQATEVEVAAGGQRFHPLEALSEAAAGAPERVLCSHLIPPGAVG